MKKLLFLLVVLPTLMFSACSDDDDDKGYSDITLKTGETYEIPGDDLSNWKSDEPLIATVENGVIKAVRVGETVIRNNKKSFKVTVDASNNLYSEPCIEWGASVKDVKKFMKGREPKEETSTQLDYENIGIVGLYHYTFDNNKLKGSGVAIRTRYATTDEIAEYLSQRYVYIDSDKGLIYMVSIDKKTFIGISVKSLSYIITYLPVTEKNNQSTKLSLPSHKNSSEEDCMEFDMLNNQLKNY